MLLVATSDAALRVYGFGHLDLTPQQRPRPGPGEALPLPQQPPAWAQQALAAGQAGGGAAAGEGDMDEMQAAAAKAALPDDVRRCLGHGLDRSGSYPLMSSARLPPRNISEIAVC